MTTSSAWSCDQGPLTLWDGRAPGINLDQYFESTQSRWKTSVQAAGHEAAGGAIPMTGHKGQVSRAHLQLEWPQHLNKRTIWRGWKSSPMAGSGT